MKIIEIKALFPFNKIDAYHKDLGYTIPVAELPQIFRDAEVTHFTTLLDGTVVAYCEG